MKNKTLSIFIDESGDFGEYSIHSPYYIIALVIHEQYNDINNNIQILNDHIQELGYKIHAIHTAPLIRKEGFYKNNSLEERRKLFSALFNFTRKLNIIYDIIIVNKSDCENDNFKLISQISKQLAEHLKINLKYFHSFEHIVLYYDNGQNQLNKILLTSFNTLFLNVTFRKEFPEKYKLFQVADLLCTLSLINEKGKKNKLSNSELLFFNNYRTFKKNYLKPLQHKKLST